MTSKVNVVNKSGLHPVGHAVLVKMYEPEIEKSIIAIPETVRQSTKMVETRAIVVEIGPNAWKGEPPRVAVGEKVMISKFAGVNAQGPLDKQLYRVVNDNDIFMRIEDKEQINV